MAIRISNEYFKKGDYTLRAGRTYHIQFLSATEMIIKDPYDRKNSEVLYAVTESFLNLYNDLKESGHSKIMVRNKDKSFPHKFTESKYVEITILT